MGEGFESGVGGRTGGGRRDGIPEPHPFQGGWRVFYTQQHGDNVTWEILPTGPGPEWIHGDGN